MHWENYWGYKGGIMEEYAVYGGDKPGINLDPPKSDKNC
jgi:hypothetical protein